MTTSYSITRDQVIVTALRKLGAVEPADTASTIDANIVTNSAQALNLMIKQWATDGIKIWTNVELTLPLVASQSSYTIGPTGDLVTDRPMKLVQAWLRNTSVTPNIDTPLQILSREEYNVLGSKGSTGVTNSVFLLPGVTSSKIYVYLTPDTGTASNYSLHMIVQKQIDDVSSSSSVPDFPVEWYQALVWGLADQLALEFSLPAGHRQEIMAKAEMYREQVSSASVEYESTLFIPNMRMFNNSYA